MNCSIGRRSFLKSSLALGGAAVAGMPPIDNLPRAYAASGPVVETSSGRLAGENQGDLLVFRGIPFAKPPVGPLRFQPAEPPDPWTGVRAATSFGPGGPQGVNPVEAVLPVFVPETSEDCLYLNVFTPGTTGKRPVLVWIHGGGNITGAGSQRLYNGSELVRRGDVVVVTINYRLGIFGFLHGRSVAGEAFPTSGNEALLDQVTALQWVQKEIAAFGGDPDNVIIAGESAGGANVAALMGMPAARGLFHKAIMQSSGTVGHHLTLERAAPVFRAILDAAGQTVSAREAFLRAATYDADAAFFADGTHDPSRLVPTWEAHRAAFDAFAARLDPPAEPVAIPYEGTTLPGYVLTVDSSGQRRPWLIMNNGSDGTASDMWSEGAAAALRRGYNSLIFDGPGQGAALYRQGLFFRPDWEQVITPVVDWLLARADVDPQRIAVLGISQGGYWVPRAVAFEHRIGAAIADPGVVDVAPVFTQFVPPDAVHALLSATGDQQQQIAAKIDQGAAAEAARNPRAAFALAYRIRPYGTASLAEALRLLGAYDSRDVVSQIRCPMLIADPEGEQFWPGQSQQLYDMLPGPKTLVPFTAAEGADLHCEPKALGLRAHRFFDWLDATLGVRPSESASNP